MLTVFAAIIGGTIVGYLLRRFPDLKFIGRLITISIFLLLFSLGIAVGKNDIILNNLHSIGLQALIITVGTVTGSILFTVIIYNKFFKEEDIK